MNRRQVVVSGAVSALASRPALSLAGVDGPVPFRAGEVRTERHRTAYLECGPVSGPPMIFLHGFPELAIVWKAQMTYFAAKGWRCVAPDMRGYGGSSAPARVADYTVGEISTDMVELHQALGARPAVWVGHDWGAPIAWAMASNHPERCRGVVGLSVPYLSRGHALPNLVPLVDRRMYPVDIYPVGQWDYWLYYRESFPLIHRDFERNVAGTINALYQPGKPEDVEKPSPTASLRREGGWFGPTHVPPALPRDPRILSQEDFATFVATFQRTGFLPATAWYLNDAANLEFAAQATNFGRIDLPVLFIQGAYDPVDETLRSRLAEPMRLDCSDLTEATLLSGHFIMLERKAEVSAAIDHWLAAKVR